VVRRNGFTLIELLIVVVTLGLLILVVIVTLDPIEQIRKSHDTSTLNTVSELLEAIIRSATSTNKTPLKTEARGVSISMPEGQEIVTSVVEGGELKTAFQDRTKKMTNNLYLTGKVDLKSLFICFVPESKSYKESNLTVYDMYGAMEDCSSSTCYLCLGNEYLATREGVQQPSNSGQVDSVVDPCSGYSSEYPQYSFTCEYSSKWSTYGCTNFCVADYGCDSYCPAGQRHLSKNYYSTNPAQFLNCLYHSNDIQEHYCVSGEAANCSEKPTRSSTSDYNWGCTNPRRPYSWN